LQQKKALLQQKENYISMLERGSNGAVPASSNVMSNALQREESDGCSSEGGSNDAIVMPIHMMTEMVSSVQVNSKNEVKGVNYVREMVLLPSQVDSSLMAKRRSFTIYCIETGNNFGR
jgi:hypothetical protein